MPNFAFSNGELIAARFNTRATLSRSQARAIARDTGDFIVDAAKGLLIGHTRTGSLSRGIRRSAIIRAGDTYSTQIYVRGRAEKYAGFVEFGTGMHIDKKIGSPHLIFPRTATFMAWNENKIPYRGEGIASYKRQGGGWRTVASFTRGQKPVYYMSDAFKLARRLYLPTRLSRVGATLTR